MPGHTPDADRSPTPADSVPAPDPLMRAERRLKVIDFFVLIVAALVAAKATENSGTLNPAFLIGIGVYQIVISAAFMMLVRRRQRLASTDSGKEELLPKMAPLDTYADVRLNRWRKLSRRLPFQLDYVLRILLGIGLIVWGMSMMQKSPAPVAVHTQASSQTQDLPQTRAEAKARALANDPDQGATTLKITTPSSPDAQLPSDLGAYINAIQCEAPSGSLTLMDKQHLKSLILQIAMVAQAEAAAATTAPRAARFQFSASCPAWTLLRKASPEYVSAVEAKCRVGDAIDLVTLAQQPPGE